MMRILESLDIQVRPSSSDSSRIGNMGEVLVAGPTLISYFTKFIQYHTQYLIWWLTVTSSLFGKGGQWTHSLHWRPMFYFTLCLPCQWLLPIYSLLTSNFAVMYTTNGKSNCLLFHAQTCWAKFRIGIIDRIIIVMKIIVIHVWCNLHQLCMVRSSSSWVYTKERQTSIKRTHLQQLWIILFRILPPHLCSIATLDNFLMRMQRNISICHKRFISRTSKHKICNFYSADKNIALVLIFVVPVTNIKGML